MKSIIIYQSFLGSTKKYAFWLSEKTGFNLLLMKQISGKALSDYDTLIVMSGTYAGKMPLTKYIIQNWDYLKNKKIFAIAVGASPASHKDSMASYNLIPEEIRSKIKYYKIPGKFIASGKNNLSPKNLDAIIKSLNILKEKK